MAYVIAEPCIDNKHRTCIEVCPVDCIIDVGRMLVIDPDDCIDCGACLPECPVDAILPGNALDPQWEPFVAINASVREGAEVASARLESHLRRTKF